MSGNFSRRDMLLGIGGLFLVSGASALANLDSDSNDSLGGENSSGSKSSSDSLGSVGSKRFLRKANNGSRKALSSISRNTLYPFRVNYGPGPDQFGNLYLPLNNNAKLPLVVILHGGGWEKDSSLFFTEPIALDLVSKGVAVWNVEYSRTGVGGGWPQTFRDMDIMVRAIPRTVQAVARGRIDLNNVNILGHSAGGHLAAWVVSRPRIKSDLLGLPPRLRFKSGVFMAPVLDTKYAVNYGNDRFLPSFLGGYPNEIPLIYKESSPVNYLPTGISTVCIHGTNDTIVSYKQSVRYVKKAVANADRSQLVLMPGVGHAEFGDILHPAWWRARDLLFQNINRPRVRNW